LTVKELTYTQDVSCTPALLQRQDTDLHGSSRIFEGLIAPLARDIYSIDQTRTRRPRVRKIGAAIDCNRTTFLILAG